MVIKIETLVDTIVNHCKSIKLTTPTKETLLSRSKISLLDKAADLGIDITTLQNEDNFTELSTVITKKFNDRELLRALRIGVAAEQDAVHIYETIADSTENEDVKKVMQSISDEEKVHTAELNTLIGMLDKAEKSSRTQGKEEVKTTIAKE